MRPFPYYQEYTLLMRGYCHDMDERIRELVEYDAPDDSVCWCPQAKRYLTMGDLRESDPEIAAEVEARAKRPMGLVFSR